MKILLDENLPNRLRHMLPSHSCFTVTYMGLRGVTNGELLRLAAKMSFDALVTNDAGLQYQHHHLPISVIILKTPDNRWTTIEAIVPALCKAVDRLQPKTLIILQHPGE